MPAKTSIDDTIESSTVTQRAGCRLPSIMSRFRIYCYQSTSSKVQEHRSGEEAGPRGASTELLVAGSKSIGTGRSGKWRAAAYLEGEGVGRERERIPLGLGEAAEEGERGAVLHQVVRVRVHRRHLLRRAPQRLVPRLHLPPPAPGPSLPPR